MNRQIFSTTSYLLAALLIASLVLGPLATNVHADQKFSPDSLVGLWCAKKIFGPEIKGNLTLVKHGSSWSAEIAGYSPAVELNGTQISFQLPDELGSFRGALVKGQPQGHWIQPRMVTNGQAYATPVEFTKNSDDRWQGLVIPKEEIMTFYMPVKLNDDGRLGAYLRNPERNVGRFLDIQHLNCDGHIVKLLGFRSPGDSVEVVRLEGVYDSENDIISISTPQGGGTFDFHRASSADEKKFYARGKLPVKYSYAPPPSEPDGWPVASLEDVGISKDSISKFVQMLIDMPMESVHTSDIHGFLLARHGKLVAEEYFHGFNRDQLHDTRSAAKSLTSMLAGAAIRNGYNLTLSTPVYETMYGPAAAQDLDPRKKAITLQNLLTMSSGLDCDDSDPDSKGNEDIMQDQSDQPDWYRFTLDQKMVRNPGEKAVYGSANANLIGGLLAKVTHSWLPDLFRDLVAIPLQISRYAMNLTPTGDAYMGGGIEFLPRDFMKLGQVMLDAGKWQGKQIVSKEWTSKSTQPLFDMAGIKYGFLWWVTDLPYQGRTVRGFFAGGNGGQVVMVVPDLDLVVAFYGGNYSDKVLFIPQRVFRPEIYFARNQMSLVYLEKVLVTCRAPFQLTSTGSR